MIKRSLFLLVFSMAIGLQAQVKYTINEAWKFSLTETEEAIFKVFDDKSWNTVSFPHTWNDKDAADEIPGFFKGQGWYRKQLFIGDMATDKIVYLFFEGANQITDVFVNEKHVGTHKGGYARFNFDITPYIKVGDENFIAIKVDNSYDKMIPPLSADFTFFGGIYRDVYIQMKDKTHLSLSDQSSTGTYISTPAVTEKKGRCRGQDTYKQSQFGQKKYYCRIHNSFATGLDYRSIIAETYSRKRLEK